MMSTAATAAALAVTLLLLDAPGGALAQGAGRRGGRGKNVLKRSKPTPADLDRSIEVAWREGSQQLRQVWSDENAPMSAWEGVSDGAEGRVVMIEIQIGPGEYCSTRHRVPFNSTGEGSKYDG